MSRRQQFRAWLKTRPRSIQVLGAHLKPWHCYRIKKTGQLCALRSFFEDGTVSVETQWEFVPFPYVVFGLRPSDLERVGCDGGAAP